MARRKRIDPNGIYIAFDGFSGDLDGAPVNIRAGTKLLGTHPAVVAYPAMFTGPNPDDATIADAKREAYARAFAEGNASRNTDPEPSLVAAPIPAQHQRVVTRDFISPGSRGSGFGVVLHEGEIVDARAEAVKELSKIDKSLFTKPVKESA